MLPVAILALGIFPHFSWQNTSSSEEFFDLLACTKPSSVFPGGTSWFISKDDLGLCLDFNINIWIFKYNIWADLKFPCL